MLIKKITKDEFLTGKIPKTADENSVVQCKHCGTPHRLIGYITGK